MYLQIIIGSFFMSHINYSGRKNMKTLHFKKHTNSGNGSPILTAIATFNLTWDKLFYLHETDYKHKKGIRACVS